MDVEEKCKSVRKLWFKIHAVARSLGIFTATGQANDRGEHARSALSPVIRHRYAVEVKYPIFGPLSKIRTFDQQKKVIVLCKDH